MSLHQTRWWSWRLCGFWLHVYRSVGSGDYGRRYLAIESDRSGRTFRLLSWRGQ